MIVRLRAIQWQNGASFRFALLKQKLREERGKNDQQQGSQRKQIAQSCAAAAPENQRNQAHESCKGAEYSGREKSLSFQKPQEERNEGKQPRKEQA